MTFSCKLDQSCLSSTCDAYPSDVAAIARESWFSYDFICQTVLIMTCLVISRLHAIFVHPGSSLLPLMDYVLLSLHVAHLTSFITSISQNLLSIS